MREAEKRTTRGTLKIEQCNQENPWKFLVLPEVETEGDTKKREVSRDYKTEESNCEQS